MSLLPPAQQTYIQHPGFLCGPEGNAGLETDAQLQHPAERGIPQNRNFGWAMAGGLFAVGARDARLGTGCAVTSRGASAFRHESGSQWLVATDEHKALQRRCNYCLVTGAAGSAGVGIVNDTLSDATASGAYDMRCNMMTAVSPLDAHISVDAIRMLILGYNGVHCTKSMSGDATARWQWGDSRRTRPRRPLMNQTSELLQPLKHSSERGNARGVADGGRQQVAGRRWHLAAALAGGGRLRRCEAAAHAEGLDNEPLLLHLRMMSSSKIENLKYSVRPRCKAAAHVEGRHHRALLPAPRDMV